MDPYVLARRILDWVAEDAPLGDLTSEYLVSKDVDVEAVIVAKSSGVVACLNDVVQALRVLGIDARALVIDGTRFERGRELALLRGSGKRILLFERTVLNILSILFGIATKTRRFVELVKSVNPRVRVAATRKTIPGLRELSKKAVAIGGGDTHRLSLSDAVLIKDNHIAIIRDLRQAIAMVKNKKSFIHRIEVEVTKLEEALIAAQLGVDAILLDNLSVEEVRTILEELERRGLRDRVLVEVSGGIDEENIVEYAKLGPDVISTSSITMRPDKVDLSLEITRVS